MARRRRCEERRWKEFRRRNRARDGSGVLPSRRAEAAADGERARRRRGEDWGESGEGDTGPGHPYLWRPKNVTDARRAAKLPPTIPPRGARSEPSGVVRRSGSATPSRATEDPEREKRSDDIDSTTAAGPHDAAHIINNVTRSDRDIIFDRLLAEPEASRYQPAKEAGTNKKQIRASHPADRIRNSHLFGG